MNTPQNTALQTILGHTFARPELLENALRHSSVSASRVSSNERLEFLGDRVLGLLVAELLYAAYPLEEEGPLARRFTNLVRREALERVAREIDLGAYMTVASSEKVSGSKANASILANACEAVLGAIYLDGGLEAVRGFIYKYWTPLMNEDLAPPQDAKTSLQEWAQARSLALPTYTVVERTGPDHAPKFIMEAAVDGHPGARAKGTSKRMAEQAAAEKLLEQLNGDSA